MAAFLVNLEIIIVSTSLVYITDDLKSFSQSSWVVTAYLSTYTSFMLIMAKLSDLYGRKIVLLISVFIFVVFQEAARPLIPWSSCMCEHSFKIVLGLMFSRIICRAFPGICGCGVDTIVMAVVFEMVPPTKCLNYYSSLVVFYMMSITTRPIMGGVINNQSSWICVFLNQVSLDVLIF
jgi:MFS family permease